MELAVYVINFLIYINDISKNALTHYQIKFFFLWVTFSLYINLTYISPVLLVFSPQTSHKFS